MRIITGFTPPTAGTAIVAGHDVQEEPLAARAAIGYLPETVPLYTDMTVREYLHYMGELRGMRKARIRSRVDDVFGLCRLEEYTDSLISKLSKGYRQRVGIAQAILHEPPVLVLDEPTIGIDPRQVVETRQIIRGLGGDHTVILSTHILPEVSMVCDRILIIHEGRIVVMDTAEQLSARLGGVSRVVMDVRGPREQIQKALAQVEGVVEVSLSDAGGRQQFVIECSANRGDLRVELAKQVAENGWGLVEMRAMGLSLEEIFLRLTTEDEETVA